MKTPDEIKKGLECCILECDDTSLVDHCRACPYRPNGLCFRSLLKDNLAYIQQLEDHLRGVTKMVPKWISVKEKLPENDDNYLVFTSDRNDAVIATYYGDGEWLEHDLTNLIPHVTHWMSLPSTEGIE